MFYSTNTLNLIQVGGGTQVKQGDLGSKFSYKLANEKDQELDDFDKEVAHINLVLDDKFVFTTTAKVDNSIVTFNIDRAIPVGLYFLEIKIRDYIFPSDKQTIIFVQSGGVAYDLKELVPNYDVKMTLKGILSDLSQKGIDIRDLESKTTAQLAQKANKDEVTNVMTPKGTLAYASLPTSGNQVGWYYYCPDGDGTHGAGNYVWNGTSWYFGGTGDEGYNLLKKDLARAQLHEDNALFVDLSHNFEVGFARNITENATIGSVYAENKYTSASFKTIDIDCSPYRHLQLVGTADTTRRLWCFLDASGTVITRAYNVSSENICTTPLILPVPDNAVRFIGNARIDADAYVYGLYGNSIKKSIVSIADESVNIGGLVTQNKAIDDVGTEYTSKTGYCIIGHIILDGYSTYVYSGYKKTSSNTVTYGAYYDRKYDLISVFAMQEGTNTLDVPDGAMFVRLCTAYDAISSFVLVKTNNLIETIKNISDGLDTTNNNFDVMGREITSQRIPMELGTVTVNKPGDGYTYFYNNDSTYTMRSNYISVSEGDIVFASDYTNCFLRICSFGGSAENSGISSRDYKQEPYTVPAGVSFIRITVKASLTKNVDITPELAHQYNTTIFVQKAAIDSVNRLSSEATLECPNNTDYWPGGLPATPDSAPTIDEIYAEYDALLAQHPDNIARSVLGMDASGSYEIRQYVFTPDKIPCIQSTVLNTNGRAFIQSDYPVIIVDAGIHGNEQTAVTDLFNAMSEIYNNWKSSELLEYLRWNVKFVVCPIVNPYGYTNETRHNVNRVDLNRNFPPYDMWVNGQAEPDESKGLYDYYRGASVLSEAESQYVFKTLMQYATRAVGYISLHNHGMFDAQAHMFCASYPGVKYNPEMSKAVNGVCTRISSELVKQGIMQSGVSCSIDIYAKNASSSIGAEFIGYETAWSPECTHRIYDGFSGPDWSMNTHKANTFFILDVIRSTIKAFEQKHS